VKAIVLEGPGKAVLTEVAEKRDAGADEILLQKRPQLLSRSQSAGHVSAHSRP
jgi:hypothetical protein